MRMAWRRSPAISLSFGSRSSARSKAPPGEKTFFRVLRRGVFLFSCGSAVRFFFLAAFFSAFASRFLFFSSERG